MEVTIDADGRKSVACCHLHPPLLQVHMPVCWVPSAANLFVSASYAMMLPLFSTYVSALAHTRAPRKSHDVSVVSSHICTWVPHCSLSWLPSLLCRIGKYESSKINMNPEIYNPQLGIDNA